MSGLAIDDFGEGSYFEIDDEHRLFVVGATLNEQDHQLVSAFARRIAAGLRSQIIARDANQLQEIAEAESLRLALFRTASKELLSPLEKVQASLSLLAGSHERRSLDERQRRPQRRRRLRSVNSLDSSSISSMLDDSNRAKSSVHPERWN